MPQNYWLLALSTLLIYAAAVVYPAFGAAMPPTISDSVTPPSSGPLPWQPVTETPAAVEEPAPEPVVEAKEEEPKKEEAKVEVPDAETTDPKELLSPAEMALNHEMQEVLQLGPQVKKEVREKIDSEFVRSLASAYELNPRLKAERQAFRAADEGVAEAVSVFRPDVKADYIKGRRRTSTTQGWTYFDTESREISMEQPIYTGGEGAGAFKQAKANFKAARERLISKEQEVLLDAALAYVDLAEKAAVFILSQNNFDVLKRQLEVTNARFEAGELTQTDQKQAVSRLARAEADRQLAFGDMEAARATFERVVGFKPGVVGMPEISLPLPPTLSEAQSAAIKAFPELKEAQYAERAADHVVTSRIGEFIPDVTLEGTINRTEGSAIPGVNNFDNDTLSLNVSIPLYQSGAEYARLRAARRRYEQSRFLSADVKNATIENVTRSWHDYRAALSVIRSTEAAVLAAESALEGVQQEHEFGERTTLDVLDAEQELFTNRVSLIRARRNRIATSFVLLAATGQLNARVLELPVEIYEPIAQYDDVIRLLIGL